MTERWAITWRPRKFAEVLGQTHVSEFFKIVLNRWYTESVPLPVGALFGGCSGVGKTTLARIIAASLNCSHRKGIEPCGTCETCSHIFEGSGGIIEVDAAFFGLVDNIRSLRDRLSAYSFMEYQVVILDECHMMSKEAFNVLLKLLEEPPEKLFFILVTTEIEKVLETVRSRLLEFRFQTIKWVVIEKYIKKLLKKEKVECPDTLLYQLYKLSGSNLRDLIVSLEQLSIVSNRAITEKTVRAVCGNVFVFKEVFRAVQESDYDKAVSLCEDFLSFKAEPALFVGGLLDYISDSFRKALQNNSSDAVLYATSLKCVYNFLSNKSKVEGFSMIKLLVFGLIEVVGKKVRKQEGVLTNDEIIGILTGS